MPPATISVPPIRIVVEGACLKISHESNWAITKKKTTYKPSSLPKAHGGALTVQPYANRMTAAAPNIRMRGRVAFV
jgi:hypothetical protein